MKSSKSIKYRYISSVILRAFIRMMHPLKVRRGVFSFSHSENETLCAFSSSMFIKNIGIDIEYITNKPRKSIIAHFKGSINSHINKTKLSSHLVAIIVISCMESAFKASSFLTKKNFSLDIFDVLLITKNSCRLRIKLNENENLITNVTYTLSNKCVISLCCIKEKMLSG
ncbi:hypothetical protein [Morganella morganii]|uniref:hypothetical protein n=1 Tax=Morganella morganii TaxID=582 RepID=UPI0023683BCE|nr:hypothetical protein [Morganella morganii]